MNRPPSPEPRRSNSLLWVALATLPITMGWGMFATLKAGNLVGPASYTARDTVGCTEMLKTTSSASIHDLCENARVYLVAQDSAAGAAKRKER